MPPSPCTASMQMPQMSSLNAARSAFTSSKGTKTTSGISGAKGLAVFQLVRGGDRAHGATVEGVLQRDEACAHRLALGTHHAGVGACQLQRGLPRFGAAVTEEDAVHAGDLGQLDCQRGGAIVVEEVRRVQQASQPAR